MRDTPCCHMLTRYVPLNSEKWVLLRGTRERPNVSRTLQVLLCVLRERKLWQIYRKSSRHTNRFANHALNGASGKGGKMRRCCICLMKKNSRKETGISYFLLPHRLYITLTSRRSSLHPAPPYRHGNLYFLIHNDSHLQNIPAYRRPSNEMVCVKP